MRNSRAAIVFSPHLAWFSQQWISPFKGRNVPGSGQVNSELQQKSQAKVNAEFAWTIDKITLTAFVDNAFNQENRVYGLDPRALGFPHNFLVPWTPRTAGGSVRVAF